ncbi:MAG: hypothetical protein OCC45_13120 [Desulfotalea sp.]
MELVNITYQGPKFEPDPEIEAMLSENLLALLKQINGFIQLAGGLHVRGLCSEPKWHNLREAILGENAIHKLYKKVQETDIPFAQDCMADQYILRDKSIYKLEAETGKFFCLEMTLADFFTAIDSDPVEFLGLEPLLQLRDNDVHLEPGQVILATPPYSSEESKNGVELSISNSIDAIRQLSDNAND